MENIPKFKTKGQRNGNNEGVDERGLENRFMNIKRKRQCKDRK